MLILMQVGCVDREGLQCPALVVTAVNGKTPRTVMVIHHELKGCLMLMRCMPGALTSAHHTGW